MISEFLIGTLVGDVITSVAGDLLFSENNQKSNQRITHSYSFDRLCINILTQLDEYHSPVNIHNVIQKSGLTIIMSEQESPLIINPDKKTLSLNKTSIKIVQRFALAFAYGYLYLGNKDEYIANSQSFNIYNKNLTENQCNKFALSLLLPRLAVEKLLHICNVSKMAELLNVSEVALHTRLKDLRIIS